jgi:very-short-patch-repair endonuclease
VKSRLHAHGSRRSPYADGRKPRTDVEPWWNAIVIPATGRTATVTGRGTQRHKKQPARPRSARLGKSDAQFAHEAENARRHDEALRRRAAKQMAERPTTARGDKEAFRQHLIAHPTPAEAALFAHLQAWGIPFEFQPLVKGYIPDFRILPSRLLVELDGPIHDAQQDKDREREGHLTRRGWRILRFTNDALFLNPDAVRRAIAEAA